MNDIHLSIYAGTDIGMHRSGNEDAFLVADLTSGSVGLGPEPSDTPLGEHGSLLIVSDGMGGAAAGEVASEMAVTIIRESLMEGPADRSDPFYADTAGRLRIATEAANQRIWNESQSNAELNGMGATVTAVVVQDACAYIAQVGDSRAYLMRGRQIKQLTKDQSFAQMLIDAGAIQPEQAASIPQNVIMQALGTQPIVKVAMTTVRLCRSDCLLLCSDGLSNKLGPNELKQMVEQASDLKAACRSLIETANERGGEDNITVVLARFDGDGLQTANDSKTITESLTSMEPDLFPAASGSNVPPPPDPGATGLLRVPTEVDAAADGPPLDLAPPPMDLESPEEPSAFVSPEFADAGRVQYGRRGYKVVVITTIGALLLIAATVYFVYRFYVKSPSRQPKPPAATEPAAEEQPGS